MNLRLAFTALRLTLMLTLITGAAFPLALYGIAQGAFPHQANTSLVRDRCNNVVGSALVGQRFDGGEWFQGRPSASNYDGVASGGSNLGPNNSAFADSLARRVEKFRADNRMSPAVSIPIEAVTASGSGLDPEISITTALLEVPRIVSAIRANGGTIEAAALTELVTKRARSSWLGEGQRTNVLLLNLALDSLVAQRPCHAPQ